MGTSGTTSASAVTTVQLRPPKVATANVYGSRSTAPTSAGTAVSSPSPIGQNVTRDIANFGSQWLTTANRELQWQDLYYRGYYELSVGYDWMNAVSREQRAAHTRNKEATTTCLPTLSAFC